MSQLGKFLTCLINPLPDDKILDWSKLKQSADDNFEFDVNSRKFSKLVENPVGKGEIACSPFPTVFSKGLYPRGIKRCHCVEWVKESQETHRCGNDRNYMTLAVKMGLNSKTNKVKAECTNFNQINFNRSCFLFIPLPHHPDF